jgi:hypothetical protein
MAAISIAIRIGALIVMYLISNPKILSLKNPEDAETLNMRVFDKKNYSTKQVAPESNERMDNAGRV